MIRYTSQKQIPIEEFKTPLETKLNRENRWVKLAEALPWDKLAKIYHRAMSATKGRRSKDARIVIGAFIIKHKVELSDEDTLESIQENMYQQYFLGLKEYQYEPVFDSSLSQRDPFGICNNTKTSWS
jgi:IS5 family transposase